MILEPVNIFRVVDFYSITFHKETVDYLLEHGDCKAYTDEILSEDIFDIERLQERMAEFSLPNWQMQKKVEAQLNAMIDCAEKHDCSYIRIIYS